MTLPVERTRAVNNTREFLFELLDPKRTPRVPLVIRQEANHLLRHFPTQYDMDTIADTDNPVFGREDSA
jgi:hypothetical protein